MKKNLSIMRTLFHFLGKKPLPIPEDGHISFTGNYPDWATANANAQGYDAPLILDKTCAALLKVKRGEAAFERDSVLFDKPEYPFPLLSGLLRAALIDKGRLSVLDYGGSLGTTYFQCRPFLHAISPLEWSIVEQPAHVERGKSYFEDEILRFYRNPEACMAQRQPNTLLLSSVLAYLPDPYGTLAQLLSLGIRHLLIDRTPLLVRDRDRLTVQHIPDNIYHASYPAWFFGETHLLSAFEAGGYRLIAEFPGSDIVRPNDENAFFKGFILQKKDPI